MPAIVRIFVKCVAVVFFAIVFLSGLSYGLLNSGRFYQVILPQLIESQYPDIDVQTTKVTKASYRFPDRFRFKDAEISLKYKKEDCAIKIISLDIDRFSRFFLKQEEADVAVSVSSFSTNHIKVDYADLVLALTPQKEQPVVVAGRLFLNQASLADYQLNEAEIEIKGNLDRLEFDLRKSEFYGGNLAGRISLENKALTPYEADFKFTLLSTARLDDIYRELNSNISGLISGTIKVTGNTTDLETLQLSLQGISGTKIRAWVIGWMIDYVPLYKKSLPKELKDNIKQNGFITTDALNLNLTNSNERVLRAEVNMKLRKYYLDPNYTFDINLDGRLLQAVKRFDHLLKTGGIHGPR